MNNQQSVFELWNYTFLFMSISTLAAFIVDMIGHKTKTISSNVFTLAVLLGISVGELFMNFIPISNLNLKIVIACLFTILISVLIPVKFRTIDIEVKRRTIKSNSVSTS